jgi:hypothetical protein
MLRAVLAGILALLTSFAEAQSYVTPAEAREIAKAAYVYGFPMVDNYRVQYAYFVDRTNPDYKAPYNQLFNIPRVFTPEDKAIQTPNSDTPYSWIGMDLRAEPLVFTVPSIEKNRYFSLQLIDLYTHNFDYIGTRTTGNDGGSFLVAGPSWQGEPPPGIAKVFRSETEIASAQFRTQLLNPADLDNVKAIQAQYLVQPLSAFLGRPAPKAAPPIDFITPLSREAEQSSPEFFNVLNFLLQFAPPHPSETELRAQFAKLGIEAGKRFDFGALPAAIQEAVKQGMVDAWAEFHALKTAKIDTGQVTSGDILGTRAHLKNNYLFRMAGAALGIYGNSKEEAIYPAYLLDATGAPLDGRKHAYELRLAPDRMPPVDAFWSLTLYELPSSLLYANPIRRYLINSPMLPDLGRDPDGGVTIYIQNASPGAEKESNWLPAPAGPFWAILRLYLPRAEALDGNWTQPPLIPVAAQTEPTTQSDAKPKVPITVTSETYIRAETDRSFGNIQAQAGGVNRFYQIRKPTPLDAQTVVRMNRDTLYSAAIVDTAKGATITVPRTPDGRFISVLIVDNDHYAPAVFYEPGNHAIPADTRYVLAAVRIQIFDPKDPKEVALVNALQDQLEIEAGSADPFVAPEWDPVSLKTLTEQYNKDAAAYGSWKGMMGPRGTVDEATRHIAAAAAWGLNPEKDATYLNYGGEHDPGKCYRATYKVPENNSFWSITVYGADGYMKSDNNIVNSSTVKLNGDGSFTVAYGSRELCGDVPNRVDVTPGWNFLMRVYRPGPSVLNGSYVLPTTKPVLG